MAEKIKDANKTQTFILKRCIMGNYRMIRQVNEKQSTLFYCLLKVQYCALKGSKLI